jgi:PBSX family phage terminase large subunit
VNTPEHSPQQLSSGNEWKSAGGMDRDNYRNYKLLPKQNEFLKSEVKETLMSGAWGSSKSYALCLAILKESAINGAQILLCRKNYTALRKSTLQTLLYGANPVLPPGSYKFNKVSQQITMNGSGAVIYLLGVEDIMKVRSMNLSFIAVDEVSELNESEWMELIGRLRCTVGSRRIVGATNPASPSHWLYDRFFTNTNKHRKVIKSTSLDNPFLPQDYFDALNEMPLALYSRFVLGEWIALENVIYSQFDRNTHLKDRDFGEFTKYVLGVDFGFTNPCAMTFLGIDGDNNIHLIAEEKRTRLLMGDIVKLAEKYQEFEPLVIVDPSAPALIAEFEQAGYNVQKADNAVDSGIARVQNYLDQGKISIGSNCTEFIKEIENYIYDDKGKPVKTEDHLLDAMRYCVNEIVQEDYYTPPLVIMGLEEDDDGFDDMIEDWNIAD